MNRSNQPFKTPYKARCTISQNAKQVDGKFKIIFNRKTSHIDNHEFEFEIPKPNMEEVMRIVKGTKQIVSIIIF